MECNVVSNVSKDSSLKGKGKAFIAVVLIFIIVVAFGVSAFICSTTWRNNAIAQQNKVDSLNTAIIAHKVSIDSAKTAIKVFLDREQRLRNIQITLLATYRLTQYEARYYSIIFDDFSLHYDIPWEIYASLVRIESNFNGGASSKSKAKGLTQVLEGTAEGVCKKLGIKYKEDVTLWSDILNMVIGFTYLSEGIKDKGLEHGVKKYVGGPGWSKTQNRNGVMGEYIRTYKTTVNREIVRNQLIYKGISASKNSVDFKSVLEDPLKVDSLFIRGNYFNVAGINDDKN